MNANDWVKAGQAAADADAVDLALPSGMVIKARRPDPMQLAVWGVLPFGLAATASASTGNGSGSLTVSEAATLMRTVLEYCCVSPRISLTPAGADEIHPAKIPNPDLMFIVGWALRRPERAPLESFRGDGRDASGSASGGAVRAEAE